MLFLKNITIFFIIFLTVACEGKRNQFKIPETQALDAAYYQRALKEVNLILESNPENPDAYYKKSKILLSLQQPAEALRSINAAIDLSSGNADYLYTKIRAQLAHGETDAAFADAQRALNQGNGSAELYGIVANGCLENGKYKEAALYADSALRLNPKNNQYYLLKGNALSVLQDTAAAEATYLSGLENGANRQVFYQNLMRLFIAGHNFEKAHAYLDSMENPDDESLLLQKAQVLRQVGKPDSAKNILYTIMADQKLLQEIGNVSVYNELKDYYFENTNVYDSSLHYAQKILDAKAGDQNALLTMARIYDKRRDYSRAINQYEELLEQDSTRQPKLYNLAGQELDQLKRKVAYLQKRKQEEREKQMQPIDPLPFLNPAKEQNN